MDKLTSKQKQEIKTLFGHFDQDGNGRISVSELGVAMRAMGSNPTQTEITRMVKLADQNGSGTIEFEEFCALMASKYRDRAQEKKQLEKAFKVFDKNGDGYLDTRELMRAVTSMGDKLTEAEVAGMIRDVDKNQDGLVDYKEFIKLMCPDA